jgi:hypothetical protein
MLTSINHFVLRNEIKLVSNLLRTNTSSARKKMHFKNLDIFYSSISSILWLQFLKYHIPSSNQTQAMADSTSELLSVILQLKKDQI